MSDRMSLETLRARLMCGPNGIAADTRTMQAALAEIGRLQSIVRINLLRHMPGATHQEITDLINGDVDELHTK